MGRGGIPDEMAVVMEAEVVGVLRQDRSGALSFGNHRGWWEGMFSYPLSLSMPLPQWEHGDDVVRPFLEGLLPDDPAYLAHLARRHQVSPRNPFAILSVNGEDCAGAVRFVRPERVHEVLEGEVGEDVRWVDEDEIAQDFRDLVRARTSGEAPRRDFGYFSLAGAQPKLALLHHEGRWGKPGGRTASSHILKPPALAEADGMAINEHFCLRLAAASGLRAAASEVRDFAGETAIVVKRFDRWWDGGFPVRVHQEDTCQALAVTPLLKYEHDGGPGAVEIIRLLERHADDADVDVARFIDALAFNLAIGGTDAHAKNYSLLLERLPMVTLAPLYDLVSMLPYPHLQPYRKVKMAMRIGHEYLLWKTDRRCWLELADRAELDAGPLLERVAWMLGRVRDAVPAVAAAVRAEGLAHDVIGRLEREIPANVERCLRGLERR